MDCSSSASPKAFTPEYPGEDEVLREIHEFREQYAAQFDYDWSRIFADLRRREEQDPFFQKLRKNVQE